MLHVDPYNDEFFKRAAEDYPLRTGAGEWGDVASKLDSIEPIDSLRKRNYRNVRQRLILVSALLLFPLVIAVTKFVSRGYEQTYPVSKYEDRELSLASASNMSKEAAHDKGSVTPKTTGSLVKPVLRTSILDPGQVELYDRSLKDKMGDNPNPNPAANAKDKQHGQTLADTSEVSTTGLNKAQQAVGSATNKYKGFYIGAAMAPELTSVKLQPARKSFDIGLLIGYKLNKNLSIELGFMLAQKYYYTSGKYVVPNSMGPQNSKIIAVNAFNSITEMPLTLQYNLKNKGYSRLFMSAGAVSYIVHKESYNYTYSKDGEEKHGRTLKNKASQNWFSNVQMSVGYERTFNNICNVRVEPYCRIPLKGIGMSDLPVTSVGVNFALIKTIK